MIYVVEKGPTSQDLSDAYVFYPKAGSQLLPLTMACVGILADMYIYICKTHNDMHPNTCMLIQGQHRIQNCLFLTSH